jgi:hypothetical protein
VGTLRTQADARDAFTRINRSTALASQTPSLPMSQLTQEWSMQDTQAIAQLPDFATQSLPEDAVLPYWEDPPVPAPGIFGSADAAPTATRLPATQRMHGIIALPTQTLGSVNQCPIQFSTQTLPTNGTQQQRSRATQPLPRTNIWSQVTTVNLDDLLNDL